jgi:hypothetical protein
MPAFFMDVFRQFIQKKILEVNTILSAGSRNGTQGTFLSGSIK